MILRTFLEKVFTEGTRYIGNILELEEQHSLRQMLEADTLGRILEGGTLGRWRNITGWDGRPTTHELLRQRLLLTREQIMQM